MLPYLLSIQNNMIDCYFAVCEECDWEGEEWLSEGDAKAEGFEHEELWAYN